MRQVVRVAAALLALVVWGLPVRTAVAATPTEPEIVVENQPFAVSGATRGQFLLRFPQSVAVNRNSIISIRVHRRIANRSSFRAIATQEATAAIIDRVSRRASQAVRQSDGAFNVAVTFSTTYDTNSVLRLPFDGVYPVTITLQSTVDGPVLAQALTFVHRNTDKVAAVQASTAVRLETQPSLKPDGTVVVDDGARTEVEQFLAFLGSTPGPVTLSVQPEIVAALAASADPRDVSLLARLHDALKTRTIATSAFTTLDPSLFAAIGKSEEFIEQVRFGETTLNRILPGVPLQRGTWWATHAVSVDGLALLRKAGIVSLVLSPAAQRGTSSASSAGVLRRPDGSSTELMSVVSIDADVAQTLTSGTHPISAYRAVAELLMERHDLIAAGVAPESIRLVLSTPSGSLDDKGSLARAARLLSGVSFTDMAAPQTVSAETPVVDFPATTTHGGDMRTAGISAAQTELRATQSMTDEADPRRILWTSMLALGESSGVTEPNEYVAGLRAQLTATRAAVTVTTPKSITLSGRQGAIRIQIRNDSAQALTVRVRMASAKLDLTQPVRLVTLAAGSTTEVEVAAGTRTNGRFPISVRVTTPVGNQEVVPYITITAKVNAIAGLGQLVGISLLLVILAWWWSNWRRSRLAAATAATVSHQ